MNSVVTGGPYDTAYRYAAALLREQAGATRKLWYWTATYNASAWIEVAFTRNQARQRRSTMMDAPMGYKNGPLRSVLVRVDKIQRKERK